MLTPPFALLAIGLIAGIEAAKVNSPTQLTQCQPFAITWSEAKQPIYLSAVEGTNTGATPLIKFPVQSDPAGSYTWPAVNITAGTTITLVINDASGQPNFSSQVTVQDGASDCLNGGSSTASTTPSTGTSGTTGSTTPATKPASTTASSPAASSGAPSSSTSASNGTHASTAGTSTHSVTPATSGSSNNTTSNATTGSGSGTSGSKGMSSIANTIVLGAAASVAGVLLGAGLL